MSKMKLTSKSRGKIILSLCVVLMLYTFAISNVEIVIDGIAKLANGELTFEEFTSEVQASYVSNKLKQKNYLIDVNGLFARLTNRRVYNDVLLLDNGSLARKTYPQIDAELQAEALFELAERAEKCCDAEFLYVQAPGKPGVNAELLPVGIEHYDNTNAEQLIAALQTRGIEVLDLREEFTATGEEINKYFYRTDHHWNYTGAFLGGRLILEKMQNILPQWKIDTSHMEIDQWQEHMIPNWFLGSSGKRVGAWYAGVDDFTYYTPKFETQMSIAVPKHSLLRKGTFEATILRSESYLDRKTNYYDYNQYCLYIGGDYPLVHHRNADAPNKMRILLIRDSYSIPLQAYFSTIFQEVDVIDLRYFVDCSLIDYIERTNPDAVLYVLTTTSVSNPRYFTGLCNDTTEKNVSHEIAFWGSMELKARDSTHNFYTVPYVFEAEKTYRITIDDILVTEGETEGIGIRLFDFVANQTIMADCFDIDYCCKNKGISWTFTTSVNTTDDLKLLLYAGLPGATNNNALIFENVHLYLVE